MKVTSNPNVGVNYQHFLIFFSVFLLIYLTTFPYSLWVQNSIKLFETPNFFKCRKSYQKVIHREIPAGLILKFKKKTILKPFRAV